MSNLFFFHSIFPAQYLLQHFVASIAYAPHLCYTTPTSNFGHDIFIMFQRPWKSPARISFLNFIAFSAKNSLRFLMMLLIHRNFKWLCTCISCMHTGQMLRYFWNFNKYILFYFVTFKITTYRLFF